MTSRCSNENYPAALGSRLLSTQSSPPRPASPRTELTTCWNFMGSTSLVQGEGKGQRGRQTESGKHCFPTKRKHHRASQALLGNQVQMEHGHSCRCW